MEIKKIGIWFVWSLALAFMFTACANNSSSSDDEDEPIISKISSSSGKNGKTSSSAADPSENDVSEALEDPSGLRAVRLAPSVWELSFDMEKSEADGFVVQRLALDGEAWADFGELKSDAFRMLLDGANNGDFYYRVSAVYGDKRSRYTSAVLVSNSIEYDDGLGLKVPGVVANVSQDSILELMLVDNLPSDKIVNSVYNKDSKGKVSGKVFYEARFVYGNDYKMDTLTFDADKSVLFKKFESIADQCNSYGQVRVVWTDKNGVSDYSDWTSPMGTKVGTNDKLVDTNNRCADSGMGEDDSAFPAPSGLQAERLDDGSWMLQWSYAASKTHAADSFVLQKLNLTKSEWEDVGKIGVDVNRYLVKKVVEKYCYYRICAIDQDNQSCSEDAMVYEEDAAAVGGLTMPEKLTLSRVAPSVWELSWSYDPALDVAGNKFIIQSSKLKDFAWSEVSEVESNVRVFYVNGIDKIETYYRMAITDGEDTSVYTLPIQLTQDVAYRKDLELAVPELSNYGTRYYSTEYEIDGNAKELDTSYVGMDIFYTVTNNFVNKNIYKSEYTDEVYYEARWFTPTEYIDGNNVGVSWDEKFEYEEPSIKYSIDGGSLYKTGETKTWYEYCLEVSGYDKSKHSIVKDSSDVDYDDVLSSERGMASCLLYNVKRMCDYFVQVRIVWVDMNGETEHSEWTAPVSPRDTKIMPEICESN